MVVSPGEVVECSIPEANDEAASSSGSSGRKPSSSPVASGRVDGSASMSVFAVRLLSTELSPAKPVPAGADVASITSTASDDASSLVCCPELLRVSEGVEPDGASMFKAVAASPSSTLPSSSPVPTAAELSPLPRVLPADIAPLVEPPTPQPLGSVMSADCSSSSPCDPPPERHAVCVPSSVSASARPRHLPGRSRSTETPRGASPSLFAVATAIAATAALNAAAHRTIRALRQRGESWKCCTRQAKRQALALRLGMVPLDDAARFLTGGRPGDGPQPPTDASGASPEPRGSKFLRGERKKKRRSQTAARKYPLCVPLRRDFSMRKRFGRALPSSPDLSSPQSSLSWQRTYSVVRLL